MTALPDPDLAPTRDPDAYRRRSLFSPSFWAMMALCVLCVLAGVAVVVLIPALTINRSQPAALAPAAGAPATVAPAPTASSASASAAPAAAPPGMAALAERLQRVERQQSGTVSAAVTALAAASLSDAAQGPRPFGDALAAFERVAPSTEAAALRPLAAVGAPTRQALAAQLATVSPEVAIAARAPGRDAGVLAQLQYLISRVVAVRRVDGRGSAADAALARAQALAETGDLEGAAASLDTLPPAARDRLAPWRAQAERRIEIDRHIANLRAAALAGVVALQRSAQ